MKDYKQYGMIHAGFLDVAEDFKVMSKMLHNFGAELTMMSDDEYDVRLKDLARVAHTLYTDSEWLLNTTTGFNE